MTTKLKNKPSNRAGRTVVQLRRWTPKAGKAKQVSEFVPKLMQPAFEKFGFPAAAILTEWSMIAGPELAAFTAPERLKWPRKDQGQNDPDTAQKGATLILRVSGARALEVDHMRPRIIERINASFGYRAVSDIRLIQAPLPERGKAPSSQHNIARTDEPLIADLPESPLKAALSRMASGIKAQNNVS